VASPDRLERLTDLVLVLLHTKAPRTLDDIAHAVPGYPQSHTARRQTFERDKRILREEGIPVVTEPVDGPEQYGYRIDPDAFYLRDLELEPDEQAALHLAVAGVHLGDPSGRDALAKLGAYGMADASPIAALAPPAALVPLFSAVRSQSEVRFSYRGTQRTVAPGVLRFHGGRWYLVAWDRQRDAARTFRVDRMEGTPEVGAPGSGTLPPRALPEDAPLEPWRAPGDEETDSVVVRVDGVEGPRVAAEVGEEAVIEHLEGGGVLLRLGVANFAVLRSWLLGLLDHAELVEPQAARSAIVDWLSSMLDEAAEAPGDMDAAEAPGDTDSAEAPGDIDAAERRTPPADGRDRPARSADVRSTRTASARLRRLLAVVSWLADAGEASVADIAARFDMAEDDVVRELELAACCGVPPYTPDALLDIVVTEESVQAFLPKEMARPRRLTPAEGLALAASARTILAVPGADPDGALGRALAKLEAVLGDRGQLVIDIDAPPNLEAVRSAVTAGTQLEIEYHSASTDETTVRVVEPAAVVALDGHWYLDAYCHRAAGTRRFRVDRIRAVRALDVPIDPARRQDALDGREDAFVPGPGSAVVTLRLDPEARWVADTVPILSERSTGGEALEVSLAVGGTAWLERLLLQLGPHALVLAPPALRGVGPRAAARLLGRYRPR
jgi:proteasome accessory factor BC